MKQEFSIKGMSCKHCVARVEEGVNSLPGVEKVKVNLKKENGVVKFDEAQLTAQQIVDKITEVGYTAEAL